jgi:class 3 adenylate cyclase
MDRQPSLSDAATTCLAASGLVDGVRDVGALKPLLRTLEEDERLCGFGQSADCLWVVLSGEIAVKREGKTIVRRDKGTLVGEQALLLQHGRRSADLFACGGPTQVLQISKSAIVAHREVAIIWKNCAAIISTKLDEATAHRQELHGELRDARQVLKTHLGDPALSAAKLYPTSIGPEYRRVSCVIWFSDIVGFSKYTAAMPPERAAQVVQDFLTPQVDAIEKAGGFVDKFMGDGVMAYWAVDGAPSDVCLGALAAAENAVAGVADVRIGDERLRMRIGLHLGEASAGFFGTATRRQYTLIGAEVNKAARLEQAKAPGLGSIRVSEEFFAALPPDVGPRLPQCTPVEVKNIDRLTVHTSKGD